MFRIKICGLTSLEDAQLAARAGADAVGLNFYAQSPRYVTPQRAAAIASALPPQVQRVGVFVNDSVEAILAIAEAAGLTALQLHGDDTPARAAAVLNATQRPVFLAIRCQAPDLSTVADFIAQVRALSRAPDAILLDAHQPGSFGGTGQKLDWDAVRTQRHHLGDIPLILAGGLNPTNVAEAIARAQPDAVDVASGVEAAPGRKDAALVRTFLAAAQAGFAKWVGST